MGILRFVMIILNFYANECHNDWNLAKLHVNASKDECELVHYSGIRLVKT
jgi:hypothetical protein